MSYTELTVKYYRKLNDSKSKNVNKNSVHIPLLAMGVSMWTLFFICGLPTNYFQDLNFLNQLIFIVIVPTIILFFITKYKISKLSRSEAKIYIIWTAFYFTVPFLVLDIFYLGLHKKLGTSFLLSHWYLTAFYVTPWLIVPVLFLMNSRRKS